MEQKPTELRYWLDQLIAEIIKKHPFGKIIVSSGISPSGPYHVGHAREILTAEAVVRGLKEVGREVEHLHFVDAHDALRKRYPYLPESYESEAGKPLVKVPAPDGKSKSYAHQYFADYQRSAELLGIDMRVVWTNELYDQGKFSELIIKSLERRDEIAKILKRVSGRSVDEDWLPIQILDETNNSLRSAKFIGFNPQTGMVNYLAADGKEHQADINRGQVKLDWRIDWPARWALYGVQVEGFGREHATKGGSYDTGVAIAKEIFGVKAPLSVPYEIIALKGDTKKMSSSLGNLVTLWDSLQIIPPEVLRYFTFKSRPERQLNFDPGAGLYTLVDEYARIESETLLGDEPEFKRAWQIASLKGDKHVVSTVPYSHLVMVYQTAQGNIDTVFELLEKTGHQKAAKTQAESIRRELEYIDRWLDRFAPENVKFEVQTAVPEVRLDDSAEKFLDQVAATLESSKKPNAESIHQAVYDSATKHEIRPAEAFKLIYQLFIAKDHGPKVGFFLASLEGDFVISRLRRQS